MTRLPLRRHDHVAAWCSVRLTGARVYDSNPALFSLVFLVQVEVSQMGHDLR